MKVSELLTTASAEVGYCGKKSNAMLDDPTANQLGLWTKYARDLAEAGYYNGNKNGFNYCTVFADWCFWKTADGNKEIAQSVKPYNILNAGVSWAYKAFKDVNRIGDYPKEGACIFFQDSSKELCHIGIVEYVNDNTVNTIEGNVGKKVVRKSYNLNDSKIYGYGYPFYEEEPEPEDDWETLATWKDIDGKELRIQKHK